MTDTDRKRKVAIYFPITTHYHHGVARGVMRYARNHGPWKFFGAGWMFRPITNIKKWQGDGIITILSRAIKEEIRILESTGIPYVDAGETMDHPVMARICNDPESVARTAADHFLKNGFSHFAFVGDSRISWSNKRKLVFEASIREAGHICRMIELQSPESITAEQLAQLGDTLAELPKPTAVMACNDNWGSCVLEACRLKSIPVPEQIAVVGVDNDDIYRELSAPPLSSIQTNHELIGYRAAEILEGLMNGAPPPEETIYVPPMELVVRESSDILAIKDDVVQQAVNFIRTNISSPINVKNVLAEAPLSRRALEIRFKKHMGHTIHDEIQQQRMKQACEHLTDTNLSIARIASLCGYNSHQRFAAVFKESFGVSALEYRQKHIQGNEED